MEEKMAMNLIPVERVKCDGIGEMLYWSHPDVWMRKIQKHIANNDPQKVRRYLLEMFNWNNPWEFKNGKLEESEAEAIGEAYKTAIRYLHHYYMTGIMNIPGVRGLQMVIINPWSGNAYHSTFQYPDKNPHLKK